MEKEAAGSLQITAAHCRAAAGAVVAGAHRGDSRASPFEHLLSLLPEIPPDASGVGFAGVARTGQMPAVALAAGGGSPKPGSTTEP